MPLPPQQKTLDKYGLTTDEWQKILDSQGGVCAVCGKIPNGHWVTDHYHVRGYKKLPPEERKKYVRGVTCFYCNRYFLARGVSIEKLENAARYLRQFEQRLSESQKSSEANEEAQT